MAVFRTAHRFLAHCAQGAVAGKVAGVGARLTGLARRCLELVIYIVAGEA